jgi:hypothetical protein
VDQITIKKKLVDLCLAHQQTTISNIQSAMNEAQKSANEYGQTKDRYDSYRIQLLEKRDMFARQLQQALNQLDILNRLDSNQQMDYVGFGAVIITNEENIFISVGLGKLILNGGQYFAISTNVPIFHAMKDKKKGDAFEFRGRKFQIKDIF